MQKSFIVLAVFLLVFGMGFAEELTEDEFYHYCYRLCCLTQDAVYVEGPPQNCIGAGPDFSSNLERCHAQCIYEMNFTGGVIGQGEFVEYVDRGVVYEGENETAEETVEGIEAPAPEEESTPGAVEEEPVEYIDYGEEKEAAAPEAEEEPVEGGLCAAAFAVIFALFIAKA